MDRSLLLAHFEQLCREVAEYKYDCIWHQHPEDPFIVSIWATKGAPEEQDVDLDTRHGIFQVRSEW